MLRGVFSRHDRITDRVRTQGLERVERGPLTVLCDDGACADVDDITCIFNGYLYDAADLARHLGVEGGDPAQLVARGYRRTGEEILSTVRGRYSLVLWDNRRGFGLVACDLLATEALYYRHDGGSLAFASDLKSLFSLLPACPGPDRASVSVYLTSGGLPTADATLFEGVRRISPGQLIQLSSGGTETRRYWTPSYRGTLSGTRDELADGLRAELEQSVRRRLSQGLSGVVLSGGLDSSIVTALASREPRQLRTYSAVFPGEHWDEAWKAKRLTDALGVDAVAFEIEPRGGLRVALDYIQRWHLPFDLGGSIVDIAAVNEATKDGADVVVDGQTGDETLGFAPYLLSDLIRRGRFLSALRLTERWPIGVAIPRRARMRLLRQVGLRGAAPHWLGELIGNRPGRDRRHVPPWLVGSQGRAVVERDLWSWKVGPAGPIWWRYLTDFVIERPHRYLRLDVLRNRAVAAGVRSESPLYDFDVIDYCLRLPPELAFAREHTRPLARHALRGLIPDDVRLNDKKANFSDFSFDMLTTAEAPAIQRLLDAPDAEIAAWVDMDWVRRVWHNARSAPGRPTGPNEGTRIGQMVSVECWLRAQSDPSFVERMLGREDVPSLRVSRVAFPSTGTFFNLADSGSRH